MTRLLSAGHIRTISAAIEHDGRLLAVSGASVDLGAFLAVPTGQKQGHGSGQLGFALFLGNLNVCGIELAVAVGLQRPEDVPDDLLLPVNEFKGFQAWYCLWNARTGRTLTGSARMERYLYREAGRLSWGPCLFYFIRSVDHHRYQRVDGTTSVSLPPGF